MAVAARRVSVATTATLLTSVPSDSVSGQSILVKNKGSADVDLGPSGVTAGAGFALSAGESVSVDLSPGESLYGIAASGTVSCHVFEGGV